MNNWWNERFVEWMIHQQNKGLRTCLSVGIIDGLKVVCQLLRCKKGEKHLKDRAK